MRERVGADAAHRRPREPVGPHKRAHERLEAVRIDAGRRRVRVGDGERLVRQHEDHEELAPPRAAKAVQHRDAVEEVARAHEERHQEDAEGAEAVQHHRREDELDGAGVDERGRKFSTRKNRRIFGTICAVSGCRACAVRDLLRKDRSNLNGVMPA